MSLAEKLAIVALAAGLAAALVFVLVAWGRASEIEAHIREWANIHFHWR